MKHLVPLFLLAACGGRAPEPKLAKMLVTPATNIIAVGKNKRLLGQLIDDKGEQFDVSGTATWSSSDASIATAGSGGLVIGVAEGMATISATRDGQTGSAMVMIVPHDITKIDVAPKSVTLQPGQTAALTATATLSDMSTRDVTQTATWTSNNLAAVTVASGVVTAVTFGQATVNASSEAIASNGVQVTIGAADGGI